MNVVDKSYSVIVKLGYF